MAYISKNQASERIKNLLYRLRLWFERNVVTVGFDISHGQVIRMHWKWYYWSIGIHEDSFEKYEYEDECGPPRRTSIPKAMYRETRMEIKELIGSFNRMRNGWPKRYFWDDLYYVIRPHFRGIGWYDKWQRAKAGRR